jgi:hypothetical protein
MSNILERNLYVGPTKQFFGSRRTILAGIVARSREIVGLDREQE